MIYFPKKIKKLDIFHKQPFIIFEKKNFFNDIRYQELLENFPNKKYFLKKDKKGGKLSFSNKDETFFKFLGGTCKPAIARGESSVFRLILFLAVGEDKLS